MKISRERIPSKFNKFYYRRNQYETQQLAAGFLSPPLKVGDITNVMRRSRPDRKLVLSMLCGAGKIISLYPGEIVYPSKTRIEKIASEKKEHEILINPEALPMDVNKLMGEARNISVSFNRSLSDLLQGKTQAHHVALLIGKGQDEKVKPASAARLIFSELTLEDVTNYASHETLNKLSWDICAARAVPQDLV